MSSEPHDEWLPTLKSRKAKQGGSERHPGITGDQAPLSATLLQEMGECRRKAFLRIKRSELRLPPSAFARTKFEDGRKFEEQMITSGRAQELAKELFDLKELPELVDLKNLGKDPRQRVETHRKILSEVCRERQPALCYQISVEEPTRDRRGGIVDLALWNGKQWHLGEIKVGSQPKTDAALQLYHYREIWKEWAPEGSTTSETIFILHSREGWRFECGNPKREQTCINYATGTLFDIRLARTAYEQGWKELQTMETQVNAPEASLCVHCPECPHRLGCYAELSQREKTDISLSGLEQEEVENLRENGITSIEEALETAGSLKEITEENPEVEREYRRRLVQGLMLGGHSTWQPPACGTVVFHASSQKEPEAAQWWSKEGLRLPKELPDGSTLVAFSRGEMLHGIAVLKENGHRRFQTICLQEEVMEETLVAYENLTLFGILRTLKSAIEHGCWKKHCESHLLPQLKAALAGKDETEKIPRLQGVIDLWEALHKLTELPRK